MEEVEDSNEGSGDANEGYDEDEPEGADVTDAGTETEESLGASDSTQRPADSQTPSYEGSAAEAFSTEQPISSSGTRMPLSPRRTLHQPPRLLPGAELAPPTQRISGRRQVAQFAPGAAGSALFDDDDRMVPSAPTLVAPQRSDGFDQAIQSPQVARFRFGVTEEQPQASTSTHSDLGELASQGGLGMFESPMFLAEEESGGRSVPTTPLQVAAPVMVFSEVAPSDTTEHASQSVPMVTTSTPGLVVSGTSGTGEDRDDFLEPDTDRSSAEVCVDAVGSQEAAEPSQASASSTALPSTSQEPSSSSADTSSAPPRPSRPGPNRQLQRWSEGRGRMKRGFARGLHRR